MTAIPTRARGVGLFQIFYTPLWAEATHGVTFSGPKGWVMQVGNLARILAWPKLLKETRTGHLGLRMADMRLPNNVTARPLVREFKEMNELTSCAQTNS